MRRFVAMIGEPGELAGLAVLLLLSLPPGSHSPQRSPPRVMTLTTHPRTVWSRFGNRLNQGEQNEANSLESHPLGRLGTDGGRDSTSRAFSRSIHSTFLRPSPPAPGPSSNYLKLAMCLLGLLGIAGLYARQVEEAGWLGLAGYLLFSLFWCAHDWPSSSPKPLSCRCWRPRRRSLWRASWGSPRGHASEVNLGALPALYDAHGVPGMCSAACCLASRRSAPASCRAGRPVCLPSRPRGPRRRALLPHPLDRTFGGADGGRAGLAGLCALVGTARARRGTRRLARASPQLRHNRSRVRSLETAWRGQAARRPLVSAVRDRHPIKHHRW